MVAPFGANNNIPDSIKTMVATIVVYCCFLDIWNVKERVEKVSSIAFVISAATGEKVD